MEDPIQRHPTRVEQLDILASVMAGAAARLTARPVRILDLGCGTGYFGHRLLGKLDAMALTGVDLKQPALDEAAENLRDRGGTFRGVVGNLMEPDTIALGDETFHLACTCLTFHDLDDAGKQRVMRWVRERLEPGGYFFIYDRVRITEPRLFPLQQSIWARIEDVYGRGMRTAESFEAYQADLGTDNAPAALADYLRWYEASGYAGGCLHLHGNVALLAGAV